MPVVDLFCGCGGLSQGFINAGFEVVGAFDNWDDALAVYRANFNHPAFQVDLSNVQEAINAIEPLHATMIIGGPPCQDFSSAGNRNEDNGRGDLTVSYAHIVAGILPEWFVMENVSRITQTRKLQEAMQIFHEAGYGLTQTVLDASLCGVPQKRKRFVLIGRLGEVDGFMQDILLNHLADHPMTVADALPNIGTEFYYRHPRSYARRAIYSIHEPSATIRGVNRPVPAGYHAHPNDATQNLVDVRALTTEERARIQTFPEGFVFLGSRTDQEQMIGNAVPVNLGTYIGNCINEYINAGH